MCGAVNYQVSSLFQDWGVFQTSISLYQGKNAQLATQYHAALDSGTRVSLHERLFRICYLLDKIMEILDDQVEQIQTFSLQRTDLKGTV